jgi:hypothetical protein
MKLGRGRWTDWGAPVFVLLLGLIGTFVYAQVLDGVYPIRQWLFWPLATLWGWVGLFNLACVSFGQSILVRVIRLRELPNLESALFSMVIGVVCFVMCMYFAGALGWYRPAFAVALPCVMLALGARDGWSLSQRLLRAGHSAQRSPAMVAVTAAGVVAVLLIYLGAMTPDALNYDATWCHLTIAQDYARAGRMIAFPADYTKNVPQLASLIHTWGFLLPGLSPPLRWMLALHNEFALFLWTLAGVSAGVRALVDRQTLSCAWVVFFLFPIIFVYDHNLGGAADHICGFFAVPVLLSTMRTCAGFSRGACSLFALSCAGALLTKYQAVYFIGPAALVIAACWLWRLLEHRAGAVRRAGEPTIALRTLLGAPLFIAAWTALLISPHFIRQAVFHHNPFYPFMQDVFLDSTPTLPNAAAMFSVTVTDPNWRPEGSGLDKLWHAAKLWWSFSFRPHYSFTRNVPAFGSLFTLLLPAILVIPDRRRLLPAVSIAGGGLLLWAIIYNVDRNLQILLPIMVCVTGALLIQVWKLGWLARVAVVPLVALQLVWGADAAFYSSYGRLQSSIELIRSGYEGQAASRFDGYRRQFVAVGAALPREARVLLHTSHVSLGIDREILLDWAGFQSLISYDGLKTPRQVFDYYRSLGISHLLYEPGARAAASRQEEVLWNALIKRFARQIGDFGQFRLLRMPSQPPPAERGYRVGVLGLPGYADGIYPIEALNTNEYIPVKLRHYAAPQQPLLAPLDAQSRWFDDVDAVLVSESKSLDEATASELRRRFEKVPEPAGTTLYLRRRDARSDRRSSAELPVPGSHDRAP